MKKLKKDSEQHQYDQQRRDFIKKTTLVGAGVTAAAVLPGTAAAQVSAAPSTSKQQKGYQVTQHVIDYYKSAAV